jgi:membrane protein YdbS with pleckstrin-like domain
MKIIERVERNGPQKPAGIVTPVRMAMLAAVVIIGAVIVSFFMPTVGLQLMCYVIAGVLLLWLVLISAAFAADKRRRRRFLTGQE